MATNRSRRALTSALSFNPYIAALPPYNAGMNIAVARSISGRDDIAPLASNENPYGCSPAVVKALASPTFDPSRYPDPDCRELRAAISCRCGVSIDDVVIGNGSEDMITAISRAFLVPGDTVATVVPSFGLHEIEPLASGATVTKVPMTASFDFDVDALVQVLGEAPQIFFLPSPWNPVGPALDHHSLERLVRAAAPSTLFVLDEAYFEFTDPDKPDGIEVLRRFDIPHVVLRTFSKAYGLAGLRVGYAVCSDAEIARVLTAAKSPFNVNSAAQTAVIAALEDEAWMRDAVARIGVERERLRKLVTGLGLQAAPSEANFLFLQCGTDSAALAAALLQEGIIVKAWREPGYETFLRVTIGRSHENNRLIAALTEQLAK